MPDRYLARPRRRAALAVLLLAMLVPLARTRAHAAPAWLTRLNAVRAQVGLRPVAEEDRLESGIANHTRYIVKTDDYQHSENRSSPYYTASGNAAGNHSNLTVRAGGAGSEVDDVDQWLAAPFHALGLLHPQLRATSYASYYEPGSDQYTYAAGLDVLSFRDGRDAADYPFTFPGNGMTVPLSMSQVADESPNPLTPCGYSQPAGLPIIVSYGPTVAAPVVSSYSLTLGGARVEACATTSSDYADDTARESLAQNHTVLIIPRNSLVPGGNYTAKVTASGITETVSFTVARVPSQVAVELSRDELDCGGTVDVYAQLYAGFGSPARQTLQLWGHGIGGNRPWQLLRSTTTAADGRVTFPGIRPGGATEYQVRYGGNAANAPSRSAVRTVAVNATPWVVTTSSSDYFFLNESGSFELPGRSGSSFGPDFGYARLGLQEKAIDDSWTDVDNVTTTADNDGHFSLQVPLGAPGRHTYRVVASPSACHRLGYSAEVHALVATNSNQ